jgi:chitosanase
MATELQKKTAQAIVNIFETGRLRGDYGNVTVARNDAGHLTYGRSQTTLASGNLFLLIKAYVEAADAAFAADLQPFLSRPRRATSASTTIWRCASCSARPATTR